MSIERVKGIVISEIDSSSKIIDKSNKEEYYDYSLAFKAFHSIFCFIILNKYQIIFLIFINLKDYIIIRHKLLMIFNK